VESVDKIWHLLAGDPCNSQCCFQQSALTKCHDTSCLKENSND